MAVGDVTMFNKFWEDVGDKLHALSADVFKFGIVTNATVPASTTADPRWGAGGTTNFATNEVTPGGNYAAGGPTIDGADPWTISTATTIFDPIDVSIAANAANPTGAYWGILYNDTDAGKRAIGFIELGTAISLVGGLTVTWHANGLFRES